MTNFQKIAHPDFQMPEIRLPGNFVDTSYADDEYPSWTLSTLHNHCCDQFCIGFQLWIAYDHQYDDGTWEEVKKDGIYYITYKNHDSTIRDMKKLATQFPQEQISITRSFGSLGWELSFHSNNFEEIINFITVIK